MKSDCNEIVDRLRMTGGLDRKVMLAAADAIERLMAERDEARIEVCRLEADGHDCEIEYAKQRGWDCHG